MAIRLKYSEKFPDGLRRLILEECDTALDHLKKTKTREEQHEAVHEARKSFKKIRACLRLIRDSIDYYKEENVFFRDLGREISRIRDATARLETVELLRSQYEDGVNGRIFDRLRGSLEDYRERLSRKVFDGENRLEALHQKLSKKRKEIESWPIEIRDFDDIRPSIRRVYKRGRKALSKSKESRAVKDFHEWRKRAKYLRYQVDILNRLWPRQMRAWEKELHEMTDFIGTLHDLHVLRNWLEVHGEGFDSNEDRILFNALLEKHKELMMVHSLLKGEKFYHPEPDAFCNKMETYWKTYKKEMQKDLVTRG